MPSSNLIPAGVEASHERGLASNTCTEALARVLISEKVRVVFGVMGAGNMHLISELVERHSVRFVAARHEAGAVAMADGYARATGRPAVATVTHGPGLTQVLTPLRVAREARSPLVLIAGDTNRTDPLHPQNWEQWRLAVAAEVEFCEVGSAECLNQEVLRAFQCVRLGGGPVLLNLPLDVLQSKAIESEYRPASSYTRSDRILPPDAGSIEAVERIIKDSRHPVLLCGTGAVNRGGEQAIGRLADHLGALITTTLPAKGLLAGHPRNVGISGGLAAPPAAEALRQADCVIGFGCSFNPHTLDHGRLFPEARFMAINTDPLVVESAGCFIEELAVADAGITAEVLANRSPENEGWSVSSVAAIGRDLSLARDELVLRLATQNGERLDPRAVALACDEILPKNRSVVIGFGHYLAWPAQFVSIADPRDGLFLPWEFGAVGVGLSVGIGVAIANPHRLTVVFEGDGGLMMSLSELDTVARYGLHMLVVVFNDSAYGAEIRQLQQDGLSEELAYFERRDFAAIATSLGLEGSETGNIDEFRSAVARATATESPALIAADITRDVVHDFS